VDKDHGHQPETLVCQDFTVRHLRRLRELVLAAAQRAGLDERRAQHMVIAVNEAAVNAIQHAGGGGQLELIQDDRRRLIAEVRDQGPGISGGLDARLPDPDSTSGRGMWLIRETCDEVRVRTGHDGTTVYIEMALGSA
jgi:anti-sigma regulatory factor (Ser/Thr protein kinase)